MARPGVVVALCSLLYVYLCVVMPDTRKRTLADEFILLSDGTFFCDKCPDWVGENGNLGRHLTSFRHLENVERVADGGALFSPRLKRQKKRSVAISRAADQEPSSHVQITGGVEQIAREAITTSHGTTAADMEISRDDGMLLSPDDRQLPTKEASGIEETNTFLPHAVRMDERQEVCLVDEDGWGEDGIVRCPNSMEWQCCVFAVWCMYMWH